MHPCVRFACLSSSILLGLALTACGDDGASTGTDAGSSSTATPTSGTADPTNSPSSTSATTDGTTVTPTTDPTSTTNPTDTDATSTGSTTGEPIECPYTPIEGKQALGVELVASGFNQPLFVIGDPVDHEILYVLQKGGAIKRLTPDDDTAPAEDWFSLSVNTSSEMGLLGMAFHPDYETNGLIYLVHSDTASSWRLTEYTVEGGEVNAGSAREVLGMAEPAANHNGGMIQFGGDGMLYVSVGDGGPQGDACGNGQNGQTHHGSILRIDPSPDGNPDVSTSCGTCNCPTVEGFDYTIPADNPFVGNNAVHDAIYAYGFRNPWRFAIDPEDGRMFVGDVGQDGWEEVDSVVAGGNYGWGDMEGNHCFQDSQCDTTAEPGQTNADGLVTPVAEYQRNNGNCSVIGLGFYRSCEVPAFDGLYFYSDVCSGRIFGVTSDGDTVQDLGQVGQIPNNLGAFGGGYNAYGDVYIAAANYFGGGPGSVFRITAAQ